MEWCNSASLRLIQLYRQYECLWNPSHDNYKNKTKKNVAWKKISDAMKCDTSEVKKKMESLLGSFRRERQKEDIIMKTESGADIVYSSTWFAFKHMLFLLDKFPPRKTKIIQADDEESIKVYQELNESEFNRTHPVASANTHLPKPKATELPILKRKLVHESTNASIAHNSKKRMTEKIPNSTSEESYQIRKDTAANHNLRDDSTIYGEHVASKHRKYSAHTRCVVEHLIGNVLFSADMGKYEPDVIPSGSPSQHSLTVLEEISLSSHSSIV